MMERLFAQDWFSGFYLWLWRADPTSGGSSDDTFTPCGKPAATVARKFFEKLAY
jgi:hypothetical protein